MHPGRLFRPSVGARPLCKYINCFSAFVRSHASDAWGRSSGTRAESVCIDGGSKNNAPARSWPARVGQRRFRQQAAVGGGVLGNFGGPFLLRKTATRGERRVPLAHCSKVQQAVAPDSFAGTFPHKGILVCCLSHVSRLGCPERGSPFKYRVFWDLVFQSFGLCLAHCKPDDCQISSSPIMLQKPMFLATSKDSTLARSDAGVLCN